MLIQLSSQDLKTIEKAQAKVALSRRARMMVMPSASASVDRRDGIGTDDDPAQDTAPNDMIWAAFSPMQSNHVGWDDNFIALATHVLPQPGRTVQINSRLQVAMGSRYSYHQDGFAEEKGGTPGLIVILNESGSAITLGLAHGITINGDKKTFPFCATPVGVGEELRLTPAQEVGIFLSSGTHPGLVVTELDGFHPFDVAIGEQPGAVLAFNAATDSFFLAKTGGDD